MVEYKLNTVIFTCCIFHNYLCRHSETYLSNIGSEARHSSENLTGLQTGRTGLAPELLEMSVIYTWSTSLLGGSLLCQTIFLLKPPKKRQRRMSQLEEECLQDIREAAEIMRAPLTLWRTTAPTLLTSCKKRMSDNRPWQRICLPENMMRFIDKYCTLKNLWEIKNTSYSNKNV